MLDLPCLHAKDIVYEAYHEGYINWNILQKVLQKIETTNNGTWMFEGEQERIIPH